jgi:eukaryotic-like serine/threonine-protein kinase
VPTLQPGDQIGDYRIERLLGAGGMAEVHRARRPGGAPVAVKLVTAKFFGAGLRARFDREVANAARLDHLGCIRVLDHGIARQGPFLVTELLAGPTLRARLADGPFAVRHAVRIADELLAALEHAHDRGVVHRDVKPENAMYRRRGVDRDIVLIDFGLARALGDGPLTHAGTCLGSPSYLAPERVLGAVGDGRADLYAVGILLYEMLCGRPPFTGSTAIEIARHQVETPLPSLAARCPGLSPQLAAVVSCALAKDPERRFARAATMRAALEDAARATWELAAVELDDAELSPAVAMPPPLPRRRTRPLGSLTEISGSL